jgi:hypothetical protein
MGALAPGVAFVADDGFAAVEAAGQQWQRDLAFGTVGSNECGRLGGASRAQTRCSLIPQNQRE